MKKKRSAYEIPPAQVDLSEEERREALAWWQKGEIYHPLTCPVCGKVLRPCSGAVALECPTPWCAYATREIPWAVFVAWERHRLSTQSPSGGSR